MHEFLPILQQAFPTASGCNVMASVVQANAEGHKISFQKSENDKDSLSSVFIKRVDASNYEGKSWPDFRRTLMYLRTEILFYNMFIQDLKERGFVSVPDIFLANYDLDGLIEEDDKATDQSGSEPVDWKTTLNDKGGYIVMETIDSPYFQDSPIPLDQAKRSLAAVAGLHAAAWEDQELLKKADKWLSRGSYHLKTRNVKELANIEQSWKDFSTNFQQFDPVLFERCNDIGTRIKNLAEYISDEVSPGPNDSYATLSHGDFKSMNCFLPPLVLEDQCSANDNTSTNTDRGVILVDFASTGVGLGMSDVAMHIHHAVLPEDLANGGEEILFDYYLEELNRMLSKSGKSYPRNVALRHYRLACADYFRFLLGRFWKSATPETFEKRKNSPNTVLMNRNIDSALAFLDRVERHVTEIEKER